MTDTNYKITNIYKNWLELYEECAATEKGLDEFSLEELKHLKWLIEKQIGFVQYMDLKLGKVK